MSERGSHVKRKLIQHGVVMTMKYGFKVYLVNPAYALALRYLGLEPKVLLSIQRN